MTNKIALLAAAATIVVLGASFAVAQTPDTRIVVHGAVNNPAHVQPVTDGRDNAVPEMPVIYDSAPQPAPAQAQPASAPTRNADPAPSISGANLNQAVKSQ